MEHQRLFVSLDLPLEVKKAAGALREQLREGPADVSRDVRRDISWTKPEGMHLTLKFLGEVETGRIEEIQAALMEAGRDFRPITIAVEGLGGFPTLHAPRVIWLGIKEPSGELVKLQKLADQALTPLGFPPETRSFHPHLTLGRVRSPLGRATILQALKALNPVCLGEWKLEELALMKSVLQSGGAVYTKLWMMKAAV
jgi:2'-5' RNA ligase